MDKRFSDDERLSIAFMAAAKSYPYFAVGLSGLVRRFGNLEPFHTMAVTRTGVLVVDPQFLLGIDGPQAGEVLVHELQHLLREPAMRADGIPEVDHAIWGMASDCEINQSLCRERLPGDPCLPQTYGLPPGLLAEEYYRELLKGGKKRGGSAHGAAGGSAPGRGEAKESGKGSAGGKGSGGGVAAGQCGSGSGGEPVEGEPEGAQGAAGRSEADLGRIRRAVAAAVLDHASKGIGNVPDDLLRWAEQSLKPPKIRWEDQLRRAVRSSVAVAAGKVDYTRTRPSRRQAALDGLVRSMGAGRSPVLPALCAPRPRVAFGVDTSGSMGQDELVRAVSEGDGVLRALGVPVTFLSCDCMVADPPKQVRSAREIARSLKGGGGTDFQPMLDAVERMLPKPDVFVFVTDGQGPAPTAPPAGIEVVWVLVGQYATAPCSWGKQIFVRE